MRIRKSFDDDFWRVAGRDGEGRCVCEGDARGVEERGDCGGGGVGGGGVDEEGPVVVGGELGARVGVGGARGGGGGGGDEEVGEGDDAGVGLLGLGDDAEEAGEGLGVLGVVEEDEGVVVGVGGGEVLVQQRLVGDLHAESALGDVGVVDLHFHRISSFFFIENVKKKNELMKIE